MARRALEKGEPPLACTSTEARKRNRSDGSSPLAVGSVKRPRQGLADLSYASVTEGLPKVVLVDERYPAVSISEEQVKLVDKAVVELVMKQGAGELVPNFPGRQIVEGALVVTCCKEDDRDWLVHKAEHIGLPGGVRLKVIKTEDLTR